MSVAEFLYSLLLRPLMRIYSEVFYTFFDWCLDPGLSIMLFSVVLNLVLLPIYYQMELSGRRETVARITMFDDIARIKRHYFGRERFYYIKAIYRQHRYNPLSPVLSSLDLYLQVLIFASVYIFIKDIDGLHTYSFLFIPALDRPDGALFGLNLLPILMTLLNLLSAQIYTKDASKRYQAYAMALLFLILLYRSPAVLVLYWTTNNALSLLKNWIEFKVLPHVKDVLPNPTTGGVK